MATRVEREGIEECIDRMNKAIEQLNAAADQIEKTMNDLPNYWEGNAYNAARKTYEEEYQQLLTSTVPDAVSSFKDYITQCKNKIIELDEQLAGN